MPVIRCCCRGRQGELFSDVKLRLQRKLDVSDKEWEKYRFALIVMGRQIFISDEPDYRINLQEFVPHSVQGTVTVVATSVTAGSTAVTPGATVVTTGATAGTAAGATVVTAGATAVTAGAIAVTAGATAVTARATAVIVGVTLGACTYMHMPYLFQVVVSKRGRGWDSTT